MSWSENVALSAGLALDGERVEYISREIPDAPSELDAIRGQTTFREQGNSNHGARVLRTRDFLFEADLFRRLVGRWPQDGDKIRVRAPFDDLESVTFRVTPVNGEPVYRIDPSYTQLRVHTQEYEETES